MNTKTVIGIDVGGTTTKIVGFRKNANGTKELIHPQLVRATDPMTSAYGAFGKFTAHNRTSVLAFSYRCGISDLLAQRSWQGAFYFFSTFRSRSRRTCNAYRALYSDTPDTADPYLSHRRNAFTKTILAAHPNKTSAPASRDRYSLHYTFLCVRGISGGLHLQPV